MFKTKRKRAVVLALIAFFCVGASTYVAIDWKRFGGGFLAFLRGRGDAVAAVGGGSSSGSGAGHVATGASTHSAPASLPRVAAASARRHTVDGAHGTGGKSDDDLFKYGDPAAGGMPAGSFLVAQNDSGAGGVHGDGPPAPESGPASPEAGSPAPGPSNTGGAGGGGGFGGGSGGSTPHGTPPSPPPPPGSPTPPAPPAPNPPASPPPPATDPIQSGGTDEGGTPTPPTPPGDGGGTPTIPSSPSAVPEASSLSMMALGALFLAVAAARRRKDA